MSYQRSRENKRRLRKLYEETKYSYGAGAYYCDKKHRYVKYSCHCKSIKLVCRRTTRRRMVNQDSLSRGGYRKLYDYWWTIL